MIVDQTNKSDIEDIYDTVFFCGEEALLEQFSTRIVDTEKLKKNLWETVARINECIREIEVYENIKEQTK